MSTVTALVWNHLETNFLMIWRSVPMARLRGALVCLIGLASLLAFASYNAADASWNTATDAPVQNLLGGFGAILADLGLQSLGLAAWPMAALMTWFGLTRLMQLDPDEGRRALRIHSLFAALFVLMLAAALAPLHTGDATSPSIGGFWGTGVHGILNALFDFMRLPAGDVIASLIFGAAALWCFNQALRLKADSYVRAAGFILGGFRGAINATGISEKVSDAVARAEAKPKGARKSVKTPKPFIDEAAYDAEPAAEPQVNLRTPVGEEPDYDYDAPPFDIDDLDPDAPMLSPAPKSATPEPKIRMEAPRTPKPSAREQDERQSSFEFLKPGNFRLPELSILSKPKPRATSFDEAALRQNARMLESVLAEFGVKGVIDQIRPGPVVTLYELAPAAGVKGARVVALADDIARNMSARSCRVSIVQGRNAIGIELPNAVRETVYLRDMLASAEFEKAGHMLPMVLGENIGGEPYVTDLAKMPHLLIAGTTGSGKSVGVNAMILSILYRLDPEQCKFIMIDPKMLELSVYDGIPHLIAPVVTDPKKAVVALKWTVKEMEDRYRRMSKIGVRNVASFNERAKATAAEGKNFIRKVQTGFDEVGQPIFEIEEMVPEPMPYIVVIIDEVADLMMVAGKDIEGAVQRLAQMARAAGIHLIMATQRPSVDVITGTIKANFPTRISFQVTSKIDSRTILGEQGAEQLLGQGDMLYMAGGGRITRLHGPFVADGEVEAVAEYLRSQGSPQYLDDITAGGDDDGGDSDGGGMGEGGSGDDLYDKAVYFVTFDRKASTSYIQRKLQIGYNRAASLMEKMELEGVVGPANHVGKRDILAPPPPH
ncbi:DNA translocase FtsK 4TM domain-containing protein [Asticcacaulis sp. YBE204]|uniref:FtsK/SpoIIIE family DNA translocase n=1 Tax=Asticcacaulis sp. YBE204 TaxID=1282363 RepID=UPI0003C3E00A|nr:DNA translocase FtsK 4TM domain-containing protein [Asticcacaulis sp. YBE204]ESQ80895.1 cell division protein FtsK [Asticcacaulis sp. YBE204]